MRSIVCSNSPINGHQFKTRRIDPRPSSFSSRGWVSRRNIGLVSEMKTDGKEYRGSTRRDNTWSIPPSTFWNLPFFVPHFLSFSLSLSLSLSSFLRLPLLFLIARFSRIFGEFSLVPAAGNSESTIESNQIFPSFLSLRNYSVSSSSDHSLSLPLSISFLLLLAPLSSSSSSLIHICIPARRRESLE